MRGFINCVKFCNTGSTDPCLPGTLAPPPGPPWSPAQPRALSQSLGELEKKQDNVVTKRISMLSSHKSDQSIVHQCYFWLRQELNKNIRSCFNSSSLNLSKALQRSLLRSYFVAVSLSLKHFVLLYHTDTIVFLKDQQRRRECSLSNSSLDKLCISIFSETIKTEHCPNI